MGQLPKFNTENEDLSMDSSVSYSQSFLKCRSTKLVLQSGISRKILSISNFTKGQLISKPIYDLLTSPKKRTDEFDLFAFLLFTANKSNSSVRFFGESTARQSAF